jgi:hypothetical protein
MNYSRVLLLISLALAGTVIAAEPEAAQLPPAANKPGITFDKDILPMLKESCVGCHGEVKPKAGLRLDSLDAVLKGGHGGKEKVVTAGDSAKSPLVVAVARIDPETAMPPMKKGRPAPAGAPQRPPPKPLTAEQVGLVRAWIDQGAK